MKMLLKLLLVAVGLFGLLVVYEIFKAPDNNKNTAKKKIDVEAQLYPTESASEAQKKLVQMALGDQYPISKIAIVKSVHHKNAYYIGAVFYAEGCGSITGIWLGLGNKCEPGHILYSVDGYAHQFSGMRKASETKAAAYSHDPESKLLRKYLEGN